MATETAARCSPPGAVWDVSRDNRRTRLSRPEPVGRPGSGPHDISRMALLAAALALLVAFLFGFITSIPPAGPVSALLIRQSADGEHQHALRIAFGAALVECGFATIA